jgi:hypothetical protein
MAGKGLCRKSKKGIYCKAAGQVTVSDVQTLNYKDSKLGGSTLTSEFSVVASCLIASW